MYKEVCFEQPKTIQARLEVAQMFIETSKTKIPVVLDDITNVCAKAYGAWPERFYIIENNIIQFKGAQGPFGYLPAEVNQWLNKRFKDT